MKKIDSAMQGFSLMELMVVLAIIGILVSAALPTYRHYQLKARMSELINATLPYKIAVANCLLENSDQPFVCNGGQHGIPTDFFNIGQISSLMVKQGEIVVTPLAQHGLKQSDTYCLTPRLQAVAITWRVSGGALVRGLV